jgi:hypothetical protein
MPFKGQPMTCHVPYRQFQPSYTERAIRHGCCPCLGLSRHVPGGYRRIPRPLPSPATQESSNSSRFQEGRKSIANTLNWSRGDPPSWFLTGLALRDYSGGDVGGIFLAPDSLIKLHGHRDGMRRLMLSLEMPRNRRSQDWAGLSEIHCSLDPRPRQCLCPCCQPSCPVYFWVVHTWPRD